MSNEIDMTTAEPSGERSHERVGNSQRPRAKTAGLAALGFGLVVVACSSSSSGGTAAADNCASFAGTYKVTTEIVSTTCPAGLHAISEPVTWTFVQTAPSCSFTMTNSLYPSSQYAGDFTMKGTQATLSWTTVAPSPVVAGSSLSYTSEDLTLTPGAGSAAPTISGSFAWTSAYPCTGTTNVCNGSVASGCTTPG